MGCILHLLHHVRLIFGHDVVQLLLTLKLVDLKLTLELFLLLYFLLGYSKVALKVYQEIWLLDYLQAFLQLCMFFHQVQDGFVSVSCMVTCGRPNLGLILYLGLWAISFVSERIAAIVR